MDTFKTMEGERIEQLERDKVALMAEIQELKRDNKRPESAVDHGAKWLCRVDSLREYAARLESDKL